MTFRYSTMIKFFIFLALASFSVNPSARAQDSASCFINTAGDYICPMGGNNSFGDSNPLLNYTGPSGASILGGGNPLLNSLGGMSGLPSGLDAIIAALLDELPFSLQNSLLLELAQLIGTDPSAADIMNIVSGFTELNEGLDSLSNIVCGGTALNQDFMSYASNSIAANISIGGGGFSMGDAAETLCGTGNGAASDGSMPVCSATVTVTCEMPGTGSPTGTAGGGPSLASGSVTGQGGERIASAARARIGFSTANVEGTEGGNLACAWSVSTILQDAGYGLSGGTTLGTGQLKQWLIDDPCYQEVDTGYITAEDAVNLQPGDILVTPTNTSASLSDIGCRSNRADRCQSGHTGVYIGNGEIVSNGGSGGDGGSTGISQNYDIAKWNGATGGGRSKGVIARYPSGSSVFRRICE